MPTTRSRTLSVTIQCPWTEVYAYASDPRHLHDWAAGLGQDFARDGDSWIFRGPGGDPVRMRFTDPNPFGVLDHDVLVTPPVHVAMRVVPNGTGAEVTFLLLQAADQSDDEFERDSETVMEDLRRLKGIMEQSRG